jgi:hypothetical protein
MQPVPKNAAEALAVFLDPASEDWERDYAAMMIGELDEGRSALAALARNGDESEMLQQRAAESLAGAWADRGMLMEGDTTGFTPVALEEIAKHRGSGGKQ